MPNNRDVLPPVKYRKQLLTGEVVNVHTEPVELQAISTTCPEKWAFVDLESGNIYRWDARHKAWAKPPRRANAKLQAAVKAMRAEGKKD